MNGCLIHLTRHPLHGTRGGHDPPVFSTTRGARPGQPAAAPAAAAAPAVPRGCPLPSSPPCPDAGGAASPGWSRLTYPHDPHGPEGLDLGSGDRDPGPADSPSDDAGLARTRAVPALRRRPRRETTGSARLRWNDPTSAFHPLSPEAGAILVIPSSNIGTAPSSMDPRECCDGAGGKTSSSHGAAAAWAPTPLFVTASRTSGSNSRV